MQSLESSSIHRIALHCIATENSRAVQLTGEDRERKTKWKAKGEVRSALPAHLSNFELSCEKKNLQAIFVTKFFMEISVKIETVFGFKNRQFGSMHRAQCSVQEVLKWSGVKVEVLFIKKCNNYYQHSYYHYHNDNLHQFCTIFIGITIS